MMISDFALLLADCCKLLSLWRHLVDLTSRVKMATDRNRVKHVVVDSGGFIRNAPIKVIVFQT